MNQNSDKYTIEQIKDISLPVLHKYRVIKASIFGSYAKQIAKNNSDIDFLVEVPRGTGLFGFASLKLELEQVLGKDVDLVTYNTIKPQIKEEILSTQMQIL